MSECEHLKGIGKCALLTHGGRRECLCDEDEELCSIRALAKRADEAEKDAERLAGAIPYLCPGWCEYGVKHGAVSHKDCTNSECPLREALLKYDALEADRG